MKQNLTVARFQEQTTVLGPGIRAVIWFHGCSFDCPGCIAAEMNKSKAYESLSPSELAERVVSCPNIEGVTLSGGDPFDQPLTLLNDFLQLLRTDARDLSVMCYTGRTLHQLTRTNDDVIKAVLAQCDILVDGLYIENLNDGSKWRGSANQVVHFLTPRYTYYKSVVDTEAGNQIEMVLDPQMKLAVTGIPPKGFQKELDRQLNKVDFRISFDD